MKFYLYKQHTIKLLQAFVGLDFLHKVQSKSSRITETIRRIKTF